MVPALYAIVEEGIYRSATVQQDELDWFIDIKTVLLLSPELPPKYLMDWIHAKSIEFLHLGSMKSSSWKPVTEELVKDGLEIMLNVTKHPVLIMCTTGQHETAVLVGCLRMMQNWSFSSISAEYRSFSGNKGRYQAEQFIEVFDPDLINVPKELPNWYLNHLKYSKI